MTTTATIVTIGTLSALGFGAYAVIPPPQTPDAFPWKDVSGGGAALLLLVALFVFLKHLREERAAADAERKANREHLEKVVGDCTTATKSLGDQFTTTQTALVTAMRDDQKEARRELQDLIRDSRKPA